MSRLQYTGLAASIACIGILLSGNTYFAQDKPGVAPKHDAAALRDALRDVINTGADLFNKYGDHAGCYRLYQGALLTVKPFLAPSAQADIDTAIADAEKQPKFAERAFALRKMIDVIRTQAGPPPALTPKMPAKEVAPPLPMTLWERLGGTANVRKVVDDMTKSAAADPKVDFSRRGKYKLDEPTVQYLEQQLVDFISSATGGPFAYKGKSMKDVHKGMGITNAEYDALGSHLLKALEKNGAKAPDIAQVMKMVDELRKEIVEAN